MANEAAKTQTINIVPVQGIFQPEPTFALISLIGPAGTPFYPIIDPNQSGLNITNSTINSTTIGATTPSTGVFTNIATTTGTISSAPTQPDSIVNQAYVDAIAQGLAFKAPANYTTTGNITLSGLAVQGGGDWNVTLTAGMRILVKDQTTGANNGIYLAAAGAWTRSLDANTYDELLAAYLFVLDGVTLAGSAWVDTNLPGGTLGVTPITFVQFSNTAVYTAGTGLTLSAYQFSITPVGTAGTYGSASAVPVFVTNASGQVTSVTNTAIAIANTQVSGLGTMSTQNANAVAITGGTINGTTVGATTAAAVTGTVVTANSYFSGAGTNLTGTASGLSIGGNAATATSATSATTATNLAGGASGSLPYQSAPSTTTFLAAGSNGQVLTLASGVPSWATPTTGTVTSVSGTGTVSGISLSGTVTSSGSLTLGGTLDLSSPPVIGGTTPNTITGTTITANTKFVSSYFDAAGSGGGSLRTSGGTAVLQWGGGGGVNLTLDGAFNMNPANYSISIAPTGTGTLTINPATAGTINNMSIGATTAAAGYFTTLSLTSTLSVNGSTGTNGQVLQSNGSGAPTWVTPSSYATVTDDTTTAATRYPLFANQTTGNLTTEYVSSTKLQYNPSTGVFTSTSFSGAGTGLTGTASGLSIGGNAATATSATSATTATTATNLAGGTANQIPYQTGAGATSFITAPTVSSTALTWNGSAFTWAAGSSGLTISDDTSTNATRYLTFTSATTGSITSANVSSTKLQFNPSTGALTATSFSGAGTGLTGTASSLSIGGNAANVTGTVAVANGGTGLTSTPTNGQLDIGNGTGFTRSTLTAGTGISITNGGGSISIASTNTGTVTSVAATVPSFLSVTGSPITTSGTLAISYSGTALPVANGGTGVTSSTGSGSVVLGTSPTLTTPTINSAQVATVSGSAPLYLCRAWANFTGVGSVSIRGSGNVSSIAYTAAGKYTVNLSTALTDANYALALGICGLGNSGGGKLLVEDSSGTGGTIGRTSSAFLLISSYSFSNPGGATTDNAYSNSVAVFR